MNPQIILAMAIRKSLTLGAGAIIGAWVGMEYPTEIRTVFESSAAGLVAALVMLLIGTQQSLKVAKGKDTPKT